MRQTTLFSHLIPDHDNYAIATALQNELPSMLPHKILFTGVGKINATHVLTRYLSSNPDITTVINYGTAGGAFGVTKGELYKCTTFVQGDIDCGNKLSEGPGITYGDDSSVSGVINFGTDGLICRSQDQFVERVDDLDLFQHLLDGEKFNVVDMEAYALAKVCALTGKNFICYKFVSDDANENAADDWHKNVANGEALFYKVLEEEFGFKYIQ
jgi:adenosylhomocysteine nucleosidase